MGVVVPVGRLGAAQLRELARLADQFGRGDLRLTVFQNVLIPHIHEKKLAAVRDALLAVGLHCSASSVTGGLVACTGNTGCRYAATNTKGQAVELGHYLDEHVALDRPINIHLTGCPHSCAQHYCGDIGLLGTTVTLEDQSVEGYHVVLGGGMDHEQGLAREAYKSVPFQEIPALLERVLKTYLQHRRDGETFIGFTRRHEIETLKGLVEAHAA
jgi:ferredoxin-nitrite reductase